MEDKIKISLPPSLEGGRLKRCHQQNKLTLSKGGGFP